MTEKIRKSLKLLGSRPGVIYNSCKVHEASVENFPLFRTILSVLNTHTYKLANPVANTFKRLLQDISSVSYRRRLKDVLLIHLEGALKLPEDVL